VGVTPKAFVLSLILCFLVSAFSISVAFASSGNWVEVVTFHNAVGFWATSRFNVFHDDWRIKWEIYPSNGSESPSLTVHVYHDMYHEGKEVISSLTTHETTGILNIHNASGSFFLLVTATNTNSSSILIVEQNTESVPEFPSWTILPLLIVATLIGVTARDKIRKKGSE
jgi:hypothetical protein